MVRTILKTDRLILRQLNVTDTGFIINLLNSPGWLQFIGDRNVKTEEQAKDYLLNGPIRSYKENGFGLYLVVLKHNHSPIGLCGLLKRDYLENPDIGFALLPDEMGKGYGFEMAAATLHYAKDALKVRGIMAITMPANKASIKLLERLGLKYVSIVKSPTTGAALMLYSSDDEK